MTNQELVCLDALSVDFDQRFQLRDISWTIERGQHWLITGANGSGKSALAAVLAGEGSRLSGTQSGSVLTSSNQVALVSYERQAELIEAERRKDDADIMDVLTEGTPVAEIIDVVSQDDELAQELVDTLGLRPSLPRSWSTLWDCGRSWVEPSGSFQPARPEK